MLEEIAAADLGMSVVLAQTWKFAQLLMELGTADQHERWLRRLVENPRGLMAASLTEPNGGSDNVLPYAGIDGGMQMRAERVDGGWVLNGQKHYISNSNRADSIIAFARTDPGQPVRSGVSMFIVPADSPQVRYGVVHDKLGERLANNSEIFYENVFVPDEDLLGQENEGLADVARLLRGSNAYAAACTLGVARTAFGRALRYTAQRVQGGRPVLDHDDIGVQFAEMYSQLESARTYVFRAAWAADHAKHFDPKMAAMPKLLASQIAFDVTRALARDVRRVRCHAGDGMEKLLRDATIFLHSDGTNTVMRKKIAADLRSRGRRQRRARHALGLVMRAAVLRGVRRRRRRARRPRPAPGIGQVLVAVVACGVGLTLERARSGALGGTAPASWPRTRRHGRRRSGRA